MKTEFTSYTDEIRRLQGKVAEYEEILKEMNNGSDIHVEGIREGILLTLMPVQQARYRLGLKYIRWIRAAQRWKDN